MLEVKVEGSEQYNEETNEFIDVKPQILKLEHSLGSISKWESKWHKPFLDNNDKSIEEVMDYIRCMTINPVSEYVYYSLTQDNITTIQNYIDDPMTATTIKSIPGKHNNEIVTSELIYYWMVALEIPFECDKWHINRLLTLIQICNIKNQPAKNMSKREVMNQNRLLNEARRAKYHTKG